MRKADNMTVGITGDMNCPKPASLHLAMGIDKAAERTVSPVAVNAGVAAVELVRTQAAKRARCQACRIAK